MNKFGLHWIGVCAVIVLSVLSSCKNDGVEEYEIVVPKQASAVLRTRLDKVLVDSDITRSPLFKMALDKAANSLSSDASEKLKQVMNDPSLMGIDFSEPVYAFVVSEELCGVSMKVEDESLLSEFVKYLNKQGLCGKVKESNGYAWSSLLDNDIRMVYGDKVLLLMMSLGDRMKVDDKMMLALMNQKADDSFVSTPRFAKMQKLKAEDVQLYANLGVHRKLFDGMLDELLPKGVKPQDCEGVASLDIRQEGLDVELMYFSTNEKVQAQIDADWGMLQPIKGDYIDKVPKGSRVWVSAGVKGGQLLDMLKRIPKAQDALRMANFGVDAEQMLRSIDGDVMLYGTDEMQSLGMVAQLGNSDFMNQVDNWMESIKQYGYTLTMEGDGQYQLKGDDVDLHWAVDEHQLYVGKEPYQPFMSQGTNRFEQEAKGALLFVFVDPAKLPIENVIVKCTEPGEVTISVSTKGALLKSLGLLNLME